MDRLAETSIRNETSIFNELNKEQISSLYRLAPIKKLEEGQILIKEGDKNQTFYLILDGEIRIVKDFQGTDSVLGTVGKGSLLGEISFIRKIPRTLVPCPCRGP